MARWKIFVSGDAPVTVDIPEDRDLVSEFAAFQDTTRKTWWKFWKRPDPFWQVTEHVTLHRDVVAGIQERPERAGKRSIGFGEPTDA